MSRFTFLVCFYLFSLFQVVSGGGWLDMSFKLFTCVLSFFSCCKFLSAVVFSVVWDCFGLLTVCSLFEEAHVVSSVLASFRLSRLVKVIQYVWVLFSSSKMFLFWLFKKSLRLFDYLFICFRNVLGLDFFELIRSLVFFFRIVFEFLWMVFVFLGVRERERGEEGEGAEVLRLLEFCVLSSVVSGRFR